ncbi:hypothetical protein DL96DRAFT_1704276 [Flagelloscypha sp. PMI_526]|nr:hypothetical protein DL96DRAFT_1704276 [Flagelloscypha sp. PMI_526]
MGRPHKYSTEEERSAARRQTNIAYKNRNRDQISRSKAKYRISARLQKENLRKAAEEAEACVTEVEGVAQACTQARKTRVPASRSYGWSQMRDPEVVRMQEAKKCFRCLIIIAQDIHDKFKGNPRRFFESLLFILRRELNAQSCLSRFDTMRDYVYEAKSNADIEHNAIFQLTGASSLYDKANLYMAWIQELYQVILDFEVALMDNTLAKRLNLGPGAYDCLYYKEAILEFPTC